MFSVFVDMFVRFSFFIFLCWFVLGGTLFTVDISLEQLTEYQLLAEQLERGDISERGGMLQKRRCVMYDKGSYFAVAPACFLQGVPLPEISATDIATYFMPYVDDVRDVYNDTDDAFWYTSTDLIMDDDVALLASYQFLENPFLLQVLAHHTILLQIPKALIAYEQIQKGSIYASVRDTTTYGPCRKQNYDVALRHFHGLSLEPGEQLNMNTLIAHDPDYCEGTLGTFMFYQGVCGGSTQVFWNALVNPYLYVVERHPHSEFWANFYGSMGEDAAIYERSKELIVENIGTHRLSFATFVRPDGNTVLLSFYPEKEGLHSFVQKQETGRFTADLWNVVTDASGNKQYEQERSSRYYGINMTSDL